MSTIDPYGLLGATVASTSVEVKQGYRAMSLLVHPDKGGSADDMIMVNNAYKYVMSQISEVNRSVTLEDLEANFATFCALQVNEPPTIDEINDKDNMQAFHETFVALPIGNAEGQAMRACMAGGYDAYMAASEHRSHTGTPQASEFQTQVVTYTEPETSQTDTQLTFTETDQVDSLEDYGTFRPITMTDYRAAHTTTKVVDPREWTFFPITSTPAG